MTSTTFKAPTTPVAFEEMDISTFRRFRDLIHKLSGISLAENKLSLLKGRISKRMRLLELQSYNEYLQYIVSHNSQDELVHLIDAISTNVTSFYRESEHFQFMRNAIERSLRAGSKRLRFWSAACSTGEEPCTMAMEASEAIGNMAVDVKILATDISHTVLRTCQQNEYSERCVAPVPRHMKAKYFDRRRHDSEFLYSVRRNVSDMITYRRFNLTKFPYPIKGSLDIIFCRNVMIYFDRPLRAKMATEFKRALKPGGYLIIGHSESLMGLSDGLITVEPAVYRRGNK